MNIELSLEYYISHLNKIQKSLQDPYSILGRHHNNLNAFIRSGIEKQPQNNHILDAGCGLSIWITPEIREKFEIIGVDVQADSINACKEIYKGSDYRLGDLYNLEFPDNTFDIVVMREVIEHFKTPEKAVQEVQRVLKPGGKYILTTPNYDSWLLFFIEHTYNRFFGGPCKPYLDEVHPSKFKFQPLHDLISRYFQINTHVTLDYGISQGCRAIKR